MPDFTAVLADLCDLCEHGQAHRPCIVLLLDEVVAEYRQPLEALRASHGKLYVKLATDSVVLHIERKLLEAQAIAAEGADVWYFHPLLDEAQDLCRCSAGVLVY